MSGPDKRAVAIVVVIVAVLLGAWYVGSTFDPSSITDSEAWRTTNRLEGAGLTFRAMGADEIDGDWAYFAPENRPSAITTVALLYPEGWLTFSCRNGALGVSYRFALEPEDESRKRTRVRVQFDAKPGASEADWHLEGAHPLARLPQDLVDSFRQEALHSRTAVLSAIRANGENAIRKFSLRGLETALRRLPCS